MVEDLLWAWHWEICDCSNGKENSLITKLPYWQKLVRCALRVVCGNIKDSKKIHVTETWLVRICDGSVRRKTCYKDYRGERVREGAILQNCYAARGMCKYFVNKNTRKGVIQR